jgi:hypothetical protein
MTYTEVGCRVARWYIFKPKIPIWVNFEGLGMEKVGVFSGSLENITAIRYIYGHLVHFMAIWYILCPFGTFYGHLVHFMAI